jgi:hypothetical protein
MNARLIYIRRRGYAEDMRMYKISARSVFETKHLRELSKCTGIGG